MPIVRDEAMLDKVSSSIVALLSKHGVLHSEVDAVFQRVKDFISQTPIQSSLLEALDEG